MSRRVAEFVVTAYLAASVEPRVTRHLSDRRQSQAASDRTGTVSVTGLCQICQSAQAVEQCERCGSLVCRDHFDSELGFCTDCARSLRREYGGDTYQF